MKRMCLIILLSAVFTSTYNVGDQISFGHQNTEHEICYGSTFFVTLPNSLNINCIATDLYKKKYSQIQILYFYQSYLIIFEKNLNQY